MRSAAPWLILRSAQDDEGLPLDQNPQLADLVRERLPRHAEHRRGLVLIAAGLVERALDQLAAEARHLVVIRARRAARLLAQAVREVLELDRTGVAGERVRGADRVLQLAHVAGPVIRGEGRLNVGRERRRAAAMLLALAREEVARQQRHVAVPLAQRRERDLDA